MRSLEWTQSNRTNVLTSSKTDAQKRPHEDRGRNPSYAATNQGVAKNGARPETIDRRVFRGSKALTTPRVWMSSFSNCERIHFNPENKQTKHRVVLNHSVCDTWLWKPIHSPFLLHQLSCQNVLLHIELKWNSMQLATLAQLSGISLQVSQAVTMSPDVCLCSGAIHILVPR